MSRSADTRTAIAEAAGRVLAQGGVAALSMTAVAAEAGVARATIHNHVRDRAELLDFAGQHVLSELKAQASQAAGSSTGWLLGLADWVADHPVAAGLRTHSPDRLVAVVGWALRLPDEIASPAVAGLTAVGAHADLNAVDAVVRWLASYALAPGSRAEREAAADILAAALRLDALL